MGTIRQNVFNGGEVSSKFYGRTDLDIYRRALRTCRNFICTPDGVLVNRPGFRYVATTKTSAKKARLIPFIFSSGQCYVLEFGDLYFRVHYQGAYLAVEVVTTYVEADLFRLAFAQSGDVLTIVHPSYPPREVKRTAHTTWSIANKTIGTGQASPTSPTLSGTPDETGDAAHPPLEMEWAITAVGASGEESAPVTNSTTSGKIALYQDFYNGFVKPQEITWTGAAGAVKNLVYRGRNGRHGFVGEASTANKFRDDGQAPDYDRFPPNAQNPFSGANSYPAAVTYFEQRLVAANTNLLPATIWATRVGMFGNFDANVPPQDDEGISWALATQDFQEVRHLVQLRVLLALTNSAEWAIGKGDQEPLTPTDIPSRAHSKRGSSWVRPVVIGESAVFVQERGGLLYRAAFAQERDGYVTTELSSYARHLLEGKTISDMAYAQTPYSIVWLVRSDGVLLGATVHEETQTLAWHHHDTGQMVAGTFVADSFESVCVIPEDNEDILYALVKRTINGSTVRTVERMAPRLVTDARTFVGVDCAVSFDGRNTGATTVKANNPAAAYAVNTQVDLVASGATFAPGDVGRFIFFNPDTSPARVEIVAYTSNVLVRGTIRGAALPVSLQNNPTTAWAFAQTTISAAQLPSAAVSWLYDGNAGSNTANGAGLVTVGAGAGCIIRAGLAYQSELEFLDVASSQLEIRGVQKLVTRVGFELELSPLTELGAYVGEQLSSVIPTMVPWYPEQITKPSADQYLGAISLSTVNSTLRIQSSWNRNGRAALRHTTPLPLMVQSIWREVETGG